MASARSLHTFNRSKKMNCNYHARLSTCRCHKSTGSGPVRSPASSPSKKPNKKHNQKQKKPSKPKTHNHNQTKPNKTQRSGIAASNGNNMHDDIVCVIMRMATEQEAFHQHNRKEDCNDQDKAGIWGGYRFVFGTRNWNDFWRRSWGLPCIGGSWRSLILSPCVRQQGRFRTSTCRMAKKNLIQIAKTGDSRRGIHDRIYWNRSQPQWCNVRRDTLRATGRMTAVRNWLRRQQKPNEGFNLRQFFEQQLVLQISIFVCGNLGEAGQANSGFLS